MFLGHHPAVLLHDVLGERVATYVLLAVYEVVLHGGGGRAGRVRHVLPRSRDGSSSRQLGVRWILGVASYYAIPSLGPFAADPADSRGLPHHDDPGHPSEVLAQRAHLLAHPHAADAFAQVLRVREPARGLHRADLADGTPVRAAPAPRVLAVFLAGTVLATVYLGWHFALDDVAGVLIAVVAVASGTGSSGGGGRGPGPGRDR